MARKKGEPKTVKVCVELPRSLWTKLQPVLAERGLTLDDMVRVYGRSLVTGRNRARCLELGSTMPFGKYQGEILEVLIRAEPGYIQWLTANMDTFHMSVEAYAMLDSVLEGGKD